ncbi:hypothetical protein AVEN_13818-1 [Araneus ventricosus]|uniref:Uncharacterized protein n=1 Tax=Araneus ventricosus TaxID=182803 RepID=A0A4Y2TVR6_ARAVE|nr:hypothetical protein AVEN_13818-1 [Araneus ventricosus]
MALGLANLSSERMHCTVCPLSFPLTCELFTAITQETADALTSPRATSILPVPTKPVEGQVVGTQSERLPLTRIQKTDYRRNISQCYCSTHDIGISYPYARCYKISSVDVGRCLL